MEAGSRRGAAVQNMWMKKNTSQQISSSRRVPQRTCVACRKVTEKRELIRLVRISDGSVEIDPSGRKAGRGAYLCLAWECWQAGLKGSRLEYALRTNLTEDNRRHLIGRREEMLGVSREESG